MRQIGPRNNGSAPGNHKRPTSAERSKEDEMTPADQQQIMTHALEFQDQGERPRQITKNAKEMVEMIKAATIHKANNWFSNNRISKTSGRIFAALTIGVLMKSASGP